MVVMDRVEAQRIEALTRGHARRLERAEVIARIRAGTTNPIPLILDPPDCMARMFVFDFLRVIPGVGDTAIRQINKRAIMDRVNLAVSLGDLTAVRREWLIPLLPSMRRIASRPQG